MTDLLPLADSQYLEFVETHDTGKTKRWSVMSKSGGYQLAVIRWHGAWRQYIFDPMPQTIWNVGCLADLQHFIDHQMALWNIEQRKKRKARA